VFYIYNSEWVEFYVPLDIIGHFGDESFQAITCTGSDNSKQTGKNTPKAQNKQTGPK